jgi:hypothetical protein
MRIGAVLILSFGALAFTGCNQLLGIDPWDGATSGGASSSAGGAGGGGIGGGCAGGDECVTVPLGWKGPAALSVSSGGCGGAFAREVARGNTDVSAKPAVCGCSCDPAHGEVCSAAKLDTFSDGTCSPPGTGALDLGTMCASGLSGSPLMAQSISAKATPPSAGSCDEHATEDIAPPTFDARSLCEPEPRPPTCDAGGACVPVPASDFMPRLCVWAEGDADGCPGDFTERFDLYRGDLHDTRGCKGCSCGPSNGSCAATVTVYSDGNCTTPKGMAISTQGCGTVGGVGFSSASAVYALTVGSCTPTKPTATGSLRPTDPVTVCCTNAL